MKYLLDTNVCITYMRGKDLLLLNRFTAHQPSDIVLCSVVLAELRYGAERSADPIKVHNAVDVFASQFISFPFDDNCARRFGEIRHALMSLGKPIGPYDTMIAAVALANGLTLVTHNTSEFSRVAGLVWEDWQNP